MLWQQMIVIKFKKIEQYCPNNAGDNVHSCQRLTLFSQPECQGKFLTLLFNPWALDCAPEIQIFQMPCELSENVKMFQFEASKHKMGRGFQTHDNESFIHFKSEPSLTLFQNWLKSELLFKSYWNLNSRKSLFQSIMHLRNGTRWTAFMLYNITWMPCFANKWL